MSVFFAYAYVICYINIRSISKHLHELDQYLHVLNHNFSVIGISETWCQDYNVNSCDLPGTKQNIFIGILK